MVNIRVNRLDRSQIAAVVCRLMPLTDSGLSSDREHHGLVDSGEEEPDHRALSDSSSSPISCTALSHFRCATSTKASAVSFSLRTSPPGERAMPRTKGHISFEEFLNFLGDQDARGGRPTQGAVTPEIFDDRCGPGNKLLSFFPQQDLDLRRKLRIIHHHRTDHRVTESHELHSRVFVRIVQYEPPGRTRE